MAQYVQRETYLRQLIDRKDNGEVKIITGPRRCGKSSKATSITRVSRNTMPLISASGMLSSTSVNKRLLILWRMSSIMNSVYEA